MVGKERNIEFVFGEVTMGTATTRRGSGEWGASLSAATWGFSTEIGQILGREKDSEPGRRHMQPYCTEKAKHHAHTQRN